MGLELPQASSSVGYAVMASAKSLAMSAKAALVSADVAVSASALALSMVTRQATTSADVAVAQQSTPSISMDIHGGLAHYVRNEAAYTAWNTDLATIDPTYSEGKLSQSLVSPDIRTAISEFHKKTEQFAKYQDEDMAAMELDRKVLAQLRSALSGNGTAEEKALLNTLNRRLGFSKDFRPTLGPKAMHEAVYGNLLMLKNATDKGKSAEHVSSVGAADIIEAMREFSTAEQARLASMTANSLTNLLQNPSKLIDPMRVMDDRGNTIEWDGLTAEVIVEMYDNDAFRPILRSMFFPSLLETTIPGKVSQQFLSDMSLASLLGANPIEKEMHTEALLGRVEVKARYGDATPANEAVIALVNELRAVRRDRDRLQAIVDRIRLQAPSLLGDAS